MANVLGCDIISELVLQSPYYVGLMNRPAMGLNSIAIVSKDDFGIKLPTKPRMLENKETKPS